MFVSAVHPVTVLNAVFCMTCGFVNAGRGCNGRSHGIGILQSRSHNYLICSDGCLLLFAPFCCGECFHYL